MDIKVMGLSHIGLPTADIDNAIKFYESLGFELLVLKKNERLSLRLSAKG